MEGQKNNAAATDGMEAKRPGEGPINKTKSMRRVVGYIARAQRWGIDERCSGKASSKLIKTKTASGLSLPRMVTDNKSKAAEKGTAVKPKGALQRRPSTYGDDNLRVTIGETSHTFRHP